MSTPTKQDHGLAEQDAARKAAEALALDLSEIHADLARIEEKLRFKPASERQAEMDKKSHG
jgi:hypothetical protein